MAAARITKLLALARSEALAGRLDLANRYGKLSLRIAETYQAGLDAAAKAQICRKCGAYRVSGKTSRTRNAAGRITTTCLVCGATTRRNLSPRVRTARAASPPRAASSTKAASGNP